MTSITKNGMVLVFEATKEPVQQGEVCRSFRGDEYIITGGEPPRSFGSTGRVWCKKTNKGVDSEFFPSVFAMYWKEVDDEHAQGRQSHDPEVK